MDKVTLSASARTNLLSLQGTASMIGRAQGRLSSGLAVSSPVDDAVKYFQAKSLNSRANDLSERKDTVEQGVSTLQATLKAADAIENLVSRMKGLVDAARSQTISERKESQTQLGELVRQVEKLVNDATYKGLNLLNSTASKLTVRFSDKADSKLDVNGVDFKASKGLFRNSAGAATTIVIGTNTDAGKIGLAAVKALGFVFAGTGTNPSGWSGYDFDKATALAAFQAAADKATLKLEQTVSHLRAKAASMATNADILKVRLDFTNEYVNVLREGADKLTLADLNEEGANLLALQTRQQLGTQALAFAGQSDQSVLSLFR
ncbi:MAG: hypothetical protein HC834_07155 [Rhodospirillales bacterium]|nr:hypothetical protein [Rhodospirillales bacterium]